MNVFEYAYHVRKRLLTVLSHNDSTSKSKIAAMAILHKPLQPAATRPCGLDGFPDRVFSALLVVEGHHLPHKGALNMSPWLWENKSLAFQIMRKAPQVPNLKTLHSLEKQG